MDIRVATLFTFMRGAALAALCAPLALACSDGRGDANSASIDGNGDQATNGLVKIDESALRGNVDGKELKLDIALRSLTSDMAAGVLAVSVRTVDGATVHETNLRYSVEAHAKTTLHASLPMPNKIKAQADLGGYVVRIAQTDAGFLQVTRSLLYVLPTVEVRLEGPSKLHADRLAVYRAMVQDARTRKPIVGQRVELMVKHEKEEYTSLSEDTDENGVARFEVKMLEAGGYTVQASATASGTPLSLSEGITVEAPARKVLLTTDKPIYQPGQLIHLRALALENPSNTPLKKQDLVFEIEDGKGNKIMKRALVTDEHGIASTTFQIANVVNMGTFKLRALTAQVTGEKTVEVSRYALPKFDVKLGTDQVFYMPGQTVKGTLDARYFFGKDVAGGDVVVEGITLDVGENVFARVMGKTDSTGSLDFELVLPSTLAGIPLQDGNALVTLRASVTDTAGQEVKKELALTVAEKSVRLALVPESSTLVPGIDNRLHLFASDPLGGPVVGARVTVTPLGQKAVTGETDPYGHLELHFTPTADAADVMVVADVDGQQVREQFAFGRQDGDEHVLVRTDKSIYALGDSVKVLLFGSEMKGTVYVDWLSEGQAVDMRTIDLVDGKASFDMALDVSLLGDNRIEAYVVDAQGNVARSGRSIVVKGATALSVSLETDKPEYRPGDSAKLTFSVLDEAGKPAVAALGVQVVDEAVFSLIDSRPGLLKTFFELEDAFAKPTYEIRGPVTSFEQLLFEDTAPATDLDTQLAAQTKAEAALAAMMSRSMMGLSSSTWPATVSAVHALLAPKLEDERKRLIALLKPIAQAELAKLVRSGCKIDEGWCETLQDDLVTVLAQRIKDMFSSTDFWGRPYEQGTGDYRQAANLVSAGPDEVAGNDDDEAVVIQFSDLNLQAVDEGRKGASQDAGAVDLGGRADPVIGTPAVGNVQGTGGATGGEDPSPPTNDPTDAPESAPRVRREFPETLYVNPSIITDADGKATISLDMADSITQWRVSALANADDGKLGGGQAGIRVFQDFFVDVSFPAEMTRGDEVEFPIVVYNYKKEAQSVELTLEAAPWYTALGATQQTLDLAAGEVRAVRFPVRVDQVGTQTVTVQARGKSASDAVARAVRVVPDGQAAARAQSGSLAPGEVTLSASFPVEAVPGSQQMYLEVYPAFLAQAVSGLDSILMEPSGCFEQTTSTTWPNVLVTNYMKKTGMITPAIELKAESLISTGYQRLLTFEHDGGGFSWFGMDDPVPYLSVTAFGLMEFADMAAVAEVDPAMIERTQAWLLAQQAADGSWTGDMSEFFSFNTSAVRNTAFTVWALAQNGYSGPELARGLDYVKQNLKGAERDGYTLALVANAFALAAPSDAFGTDLLTELESMKRVSGDKINWDAGDTQTQFYAAGDDAAVTATALVTHAMIIAGGHASTVNGALAYLTASKDPQGNFGSTQATVWVLKTLLLSALKGTEGAIGTLDVSVDGKAFSTVQLTSAESDVMTLVDMSTLATSGDHSVTLSFAGTGKVSYNLVGKHNLPWANVTPPDAGPLGITITYDRTTLAVDESVQATVNVTNKMATAENMILVTVGIPPGFELLTEDLDAYVAQQQLSRYEKTGKELILYVSNLAPNELRPFVYRLRATMPVRAVDGGAEAHPYYEPTLSSEAAATQLVAKAM